jgi:hypothetical protein
MTVALAQPDFDARRWGYLVSLLSMDVVRPFHDLMGLRLADPVGLQRVLRQEIVAERKKGVASPDAGQPTIAQRVLKVVREALGAEASRRLDWWEQHIFHKKPSRDNVNVRKWATVLQISRHEPRLWNRLGLPNGARDRFRRACDLDEYRRRQKEVDASPLSDWDLHLYAFHLYDDNLYGPNDFVRVPDGPRLRVVPTIRAYQGYEFWAWVLSTLRPDRLDRLWQEGRRIVEEEELPSARELPHPSVLDIGP